MLWQVILILLLWRKFFQHINFTTTIKPTASILPCLLESARDSELTITSVNPEDPAPLLFRYKCGYVPAGVFPALITNLVSQQREDWELIEDGLRKNRVQFVGEDYDMVTFISCLRYFEIVITRVEEFERLIESLCAHVRSVFQSTLEQVTSTMNYKLTMGYKLALECPAHPGKEYLCILTKESVKKMLCQEKTKICTRKASQDVGQL